MYPLWRHSDEWRGPARYGSEPGRHHHRRPADDWSDGQEWLLRRVVAELTRDRRIQGGRVVVTVHNTVVVLEGEVLSGEAWTAASRAAWAVPGVSDVANRLTVRDERLHP
jgi:hypothetical protein